MNFDEVIDRRGTHCMKWDMMERLYGVSADTGTAMWVADMDFRPPAAAGRALQRMLDHGIYGYYGDERSYRDAICRWMRNRHGWDIEPEWIFSTHGLVNGTALCIDCFTRPGDRVVLFTPVYHAFARVLTAAGREIVECRLALNEGRYEFDFDAYDRQMKGGETLAILCSPHNPGGRVWYRRELRAMAEFCERHDLLLVSDEIHHDLVLPGHDHIAMPLAAPEAQQRTIMLTATTKTFNLAGAHIGNVIIADDRLRAVFAARMAALGISPNSFGLFLAEAVYSDEGAEWVDHLVRYLDANREIFDRRINALPGLASMQLEATYLAWVNFSDTGLAPEEVSRRIEQVARIAVNRGPTFGAGGAGFHRFNLATPRIVMEAALDRLEAAFSG
ncbi:MAG: pyridoxal phosphate-dependent aminotransferase [Rhodobacteraceae bacterium]|nr:pyridoxal phosphate-dependent aminotransferase [Paracoccaceae bacterium]